MAYLPMISGGGCDLTGTLIWTNPNPSTSQQWIQLITPTQLEEYDYFRFVWCASTTDQSNTCEAVVSATDLKKSIQSTTACRLGMLCRVVGSGGSALTSCRQTFYNYDSSKKGIWVSDAFKLNSTGSDNSKCMPLYVYGIKA